MEPLRRAVPERAGDVALAVGAGTLAIAGAWLASRTSGEPALTAAGALLLALGAAPLAWSRRWPLPASLATGVFTVIYGVAELPDPPFPVAPVVSLYVVARRCSRRTTVVAAVIVLLVMVFAIWAAGDSGPDDVYVQVLAAVIALVLGDQARIRAAAAAQAHERSLEEAVEGERARLARDLHDIVAHHVSMVVVQAEAGAAAAGAHGGADEVAAFDAIAESSRVALGELRLLLDVLRDPDDGAPTAPQPTLEDLPGLIERVRGAGIDVQFAEQGPPSAMTPAASLGAYRIVQEGLTNVVRHAPGATAEVALRWSAEQVEIRVHNGPPGHGPERDGVSPGPGRGLLGIRERAELVGGTVRADPCPDGGFEVVARLPTRLAAP